jgi:putative phosphoribosyl transferase
MKGEFSRQFFNREDAGDMLTSLLRPIVDTNTTVVMGICSGGLIVASKVAQACKMPLYPVLIKRIPSIQNADEAAGAFASDERCIVPKNLLDKENQQREHVLAFIQREIFLLRSHPLASWAESADLDGRTALIVDDGCATGFSMLCALQLTRLKGARKIIAATPVLSPQARVRIQPEVDKLLCIYNPEIFLNVRIFYQDFREVNLGRLEEIASLYGAFHG